MSGAPINQKLIIYEITFSIHVLLKLKWEVMAFCNLWETSVKRWPAHNKKKKTLFAQCILFDSVDFSFTTQVDIFVYDSFKMLSIGRMFLSNKAHKFTSIWKFIGNL